MLNIDIDVGTDSIDKNIVAQLSRIMRLPLVPGARLIFSISFEFELMTPEGTGAAYALR